MEKKIKFKDVFTDHPGGRLRSDGPLSGEEFYETVLRPEFLTLNKENDCLIIDISDIYGMAPSFIDGSFAELARNYPQSYRNVDVTSDNLVMDTDLIEDIREIMLVP